MSFVVRFICKIISFVLGKFGRGSDLPGNIALKLDKKILKKFKQPPVVIAVTGSSGKGSISYMIYKTLKDSGLRVSCNVEGSNLSSGITSLYLKNSSLTGKTKLDAIVLEVDERYTKEVFSAVKPTHIILSNITRDQPPRHGNYRKVYSTIEGAIPETATLIINKDDPIVTTLSKEKNNKTISYGCCKNSDSFNFLESNCLDMVYCEKCHSKLKYDYVQYGCIGSYECPTCDFKRGSVDYEITSVSKDYIKINNKYKVKINFNMMYLYYNILAAFSVLKELKIDDKIIIDSLNSIEFHNKRMDTIKFNERSCEILNGKNENAVSYNQAINYIRTKDQKKTIIFGFRYISKKYEYQDISWLYDIDFEFLTNVDTIICFGDWANDIAARFLIGGFKKEQIKIIKSFENLKEILNETEGDIYAILNMGDEVPFLESINN